MAKISTKELFDQYYKDWEPVKAKKVRPQIDRPEVYAFEQKIGKQLVEMNVDELFEMVLSFNNNNHPEDPNYVINYNSFNQIASGYRDLFNFYISHYEVIVNPWYDKRMRGAQATQRLAQDKPAFTYKNVEEAIQRVQGHYEPERAKYIECILLLFYCGFAKSEEIVNLEESMIDEETKTINLRGRTIRLTDRCFELLQYVHNLDSLPGWRGDYTMASWRGKYFKYNIRPKQVDTFDDRTETEVAALINRTIIVCVKNEFGMEINYRLLYLCGFYDSLVREYGEERAQELILSVRNPVDTEDLMIHAEYYGIEVSNVSQFKRSLRPLINIKHE